MRKKESFLQSMGASVFWQGLNLISGLAKHIIIAGAIGLSAQLDVFYLAVAILGVAVFSWGRLLDVLAVPNAVAYRTQGETKKFESLAAGLVSLSLVAGLGVAVILLVGVDVVVRIPVGLDDHRREMLRTGFLWLTPIALFYLPYRSLGAVLRSLRRFSIFYQAEAIISIGTLALVALFYDRPQILFWSFSAAIVLATAYSISRSRGKFPLLGHPFSAEVRQTLGVAPQLLLLHGAVYLYQLADSIFISFLGEGSVGALAYAWTLMSVIPVLLNFGGAFITVFAERRSSGDSGEDVLNDLISMALLVGIPASVLLATHGEGIIALLLQRGVFSAADSSLTAMALLGYSAGLVGLLLIPVCDQVFQVLERLGLQTRRVGAGLAVNVVLNWVFLFKFGWGVWGIALATSISYTTMLILSLQAIHAQGIDIHLRRHLRWLVVVAAASAVGAFASRLVTGDGSKLIVIVQTLVFVATFLVIVNLIPVGEVKLFRRTLGRLVPGGRS